MAEKDNKDVVEVPLKILTEMQEQMAATEKKLADLEAKNNGLEALVNEKASSTDEPKLREKKSFEPKFRTVRLRKYPIAGDENNLGYVIGWTNKGAYQEVDRSGVSPQIVDCIDILFLGQEKTKDGKLKAEKVKLLDLMNNGQQVHCKIIESKTDKRTEPTGEEIDISVFDPAHGLISTGEKIDGFVTFSDISYKLQVPGHGEVWVDGAFVNA